MKWKQISPYVFWIGFFGLMIGNMYVFIQGIRLSDEIQRFEQDIVQLKKENIEIETTIYKVDSLQYAASLSAQMDYVKKADPLYLGKPGYASAK